VPQITLGRVNGYDLAKVIDLALIDKPRILIKTAGQLRRLVLRQSSIDR